LLLGENKGEVRKDVNYMGVSQSANKSFPYVYHALVSHNFVFWVFVKKEGCTIEKLLKNVWSTFVLLINQFG
jgi:hypothetical protein